MNKQHVENVYGMWAEEKGWHYVKRCDRDNGNHWHMGDKCETFDNVKYSIPHIDYPFLHEIIKGLDHMERRNFLSSLILLLRWEPDKLGDNNFHIALITATVDQILEALFEVDF